MPVTSFWIWVETVKDSYGLCCNTTQKCLTPERIITLEAYRRSHPKRTTNLIRIHVIKTGRRQLMVPIDPLAPRKPTEASLHRNPEVWGGKGFYPPKAVA